MECTNLVDPHQLLYLWFTVVFVLCSQNRLSTKSEVYFGFSLSWDTHIGKILTKANRSLGFIRRNLGRCPTNIKRQAYLSLVRPHLEYASSVWDPHLQKHIYQIERVQRRAARFIKHEYSRDHGIVTSILQELELQALQERRKTSRLLVFHKITHQKVAIPLPPYLQKPTRTDSTIPSKKMRKDRLNWRSAETQLLCT